MASPAGISMGGGLSDAPPGGGITPSGSDISADLGSTLGSAFDSAIAADETPASEPASEPAAEPVAEPAAEEPVVEEPVAEPVAEPADATPEAAPVAATPAGAPQYQMTPDGKAYQVPKADFQRIQQAQQYHAQVAQFFPTLQHAQTSYQQASDLRTMLNDYIGGSPDNIQAVMNYWAGGDHAPGSPIQRQFQQSFGEMAKLMPDMLAKMNPQAHDAMIDSLVGKRIESLYEKAATTGDPEDLKRAQEFDWGVTGQYKTELPKVDPAAKAQQEFEQRQQQFNRQRQTMLDSQLRDFNTRSVEGAKFNQVNGLVDSALAKIKDRYTPIAYNDIRNGIITELKNAMAGQPTESFPQGIPGQREWYAEHRQSFDQLVNDYRHSFDQNPSAAGRGLEAQAQAYRQAYINRANQYLPAIAAPRINAATRTPGAARTAPTAKQPARAASQPAPSAPARDPNKRMSSDEWQSELNKVLTVA